MNAELNLNEILSQVKRLNKIDQVALLERISLLVHKTKKPSQATKLSDIAGVGASLWNAESIDEYVDSERQW